MLRKTARGFSEGKDVGCGNRSGFDSHLFTVGNGRAFAVGLALFAALGGCDDGSRGRANSAFQPTTETDEDPVSAVESLNFDAIAQDLVSQANQPLDPDAPGGDDGSAESDENAPENPDDSEPSEEDPAGEEPSSEEPETCGGFECADGTCIDASWECDGVDDCSAAEDEANCAEACTGHTCGDGSCIQADWVCDELVDCADGSDEATCSVQVAALDLVGERNPLALDTTCVFTSTVATAAAGAATAEVISTSCVAGGVLVGVVTSETGVGAVGGFGVAAVCGVADITQVDALAGGLAGAVGGLVGGVTFCDGGVVDQANNFINWLWGTEPESIPVYNMASSGAAEVPGLQSDALTCTPSASNRESAYHDPSACGDDVFGMTCSPGAATETQCAEWKDIADRNLVCHWARIVSANTFRGGQPDANHVAPIRAARNNYEGCATLIEDNCDPDHDPESEDDAKASAMTLICG